MSKKGTSKRPLYDTDVVMRKLYDSLVRDFRFEMGPEYHQEHLNALRHGVPALRGMKVPDRLQAPPRLFKMEAQLENLFKRYRFKADVYTDKELDAITQAKFDENQLRLARHRWRPIKYSTSLVLRQARKLVREILAKVDLHEFETRCRFSTRATQGCAARDAYIDHKFSSPISGSPEHVEWFRRHTWGHWYLATALEQCNPPENGLPFFSTCESLDLVKVPKSYKSLRPIMPNTLIGSYYTYGLGCILADALKEEGLDIAKLQFQHRKFAKLSSIHRAWVTADLSNASESFLIELICRLLPRKWFNALKCGRLSNYTVDGQQYHYVSFMAMGIGFTFPLQTLLFYAIVKSCCMLLGENEGLISVYGDDLIYPRKAHKYVEAVLTDLGMLLNKDKTFVESHFRESCGGDYYHGVDVRPFSPEGEHRLLGAKRYEAWLYQITNGLFARWDLDELPITSRFLRLEILRVARLVKQVPMSYPDYSGWRCYTPDTSVFSGMAPVLCRFHNGSREYVIPHLTLKPRYRFVSFEEAYLYDWLRAKEAGEIKQEEGPTNYHLMTLKEWRKAEDAWRSHKQLSTRLRDFESRQDVDSATDTFKLIRAPRQPKRYRTINGRRLVRSLPATPCKLTLPNITSETGSISDWI